MANAPFDNSGKGPLRVPGFNGIPRSARAYDYGVPGRSSFEAKSSLVWFQTPGVTLRELGVVQTIARITDKDSWYLHVADPKIQQEWRTEAVEWARDLQSDPKIDSIYGGMDPEVSERKVPSSQSLMNEATWQWCLAELLDKAEVFRLTGTTLVLNCAAGVCKSENVFLEKLKATLQARLSSAGYESSAIPRTRSLPYTLWNYSRLVDPSSHSLTRNQTSVLVHGGFISLDYPLDVCVPQSRKIEGDFCGLEDSNAEDDRPIGEKQNYRDFKGYRCTAEDDYEERFNKFKFSIGQWLPCDLEFCSENKDDLRVVSYINNLHPSHHDLYQIVEQLTSHAVKAWNEVLLKCDERGHYKNRYPLRVKTYGVEWSNWSDPPSTARLAKRHRYSEYLMESDNLRHETIRRHYAKFGVRQAKTTDICAQLDNGFESEWRRNLEVRDDDTVFWKHPDPGLSFTYVEWKQGLTAEAIIPRLEDRFYRNKSISALRDENHDFYKISLADDYEDSGLQLYVEIAGIEWLPEDGEFCGSGSKIDGLFDEHIVASAIYSYSISNFTNGKLSFEHITRTFAEDVGYGGNLRKIPRELREVYDDPCDFHEFEYDYEFQDRFQLPEHSQQYLGSVAIKEGRMIAWPNHFLHSEVGWSLIDKTKPGHHRFVKLMLVDPNYRLCSTRNVRAQQPDWWRHAAMEAADLGRFGLPAELIEMIAGHLTDEDAPSQVHRKNKPTQKK